MPRGLYTRRNNYIPAAGSVRPQWSMVEVMHVRIAAYSGIKIRGSIVAATSLPCEAYARHKSILGSINRATATDAAAAVDCCRDPGERTGCDCCCHRFALSFLRTSV